MRITEILREGTHHISNDAKSSIRGAVTTPDANNNGGDAYKSYRFGLAMAGAPEFPTKATNDIGGDPLITSYTDAEFEMILYAGKQSNVGKIKQLTNNKSQEPKDTQKTSIVANIKRNKFGV